ncbi:MAG: YbaB/EbfC family nucleoid-associated protein [Oscillospiraceae bacterium]|jgi:DNA-binding YbaB/EbfC family protein|nr:YbaB/EbfC family nucleoid-associated protein [Oscillospiraceae bacterium]
MKSRIPKGNIGAQPQNMSAMIKQAQKMQNDISKLQEDIEGRSFSAQAGGGAVEVTMLGNKTITALKITPETVKDSVEDVEMIQDLVISAINACVALIEETTEEEMEKVTGGVSLPGLF